MGEMTGYCRIGPGERYSVKDVVKGALATAAVLATLYVGGGSDSRSMEEKLKGSSGISQLNILERVIWGANKQVKDDPLGELGSAWHLMHGPS